jgi:hypothetical protein
MTDHLTHEQLLRYLDGELSKRSMRLAAAHIRSCWACGTELERLKEDIGVIIDAQNQVLFPSIPPPSRPWPGLEAKLLAAGAAAPFSWRRLRPSLPGFRRPALAIATFVAAACIAILLWQQPPRPTEPAVSAQEVLRLVSQADGQRISPAPGHVIRQSVRITEIQRLPHSVRSGAFDSWRTNSASYWRTANHSAASDLEEHYQRRRLKDLPLSPVSYSTWSEAAGGSGTVSRNGPDLRVSFNATGRAEEGSLRKVSFRVEPATWHVTGMDLAFADADFEVREEGLAAIRKSDVPADVLAHLEPPLRRREERALPAADVEPAEAHVPAPAPVPDENDTEMDVRFLLHEIGADMGEPIDIARGPSGQVIVRAWDLAPARWELLTQVLRGRPDVEVRDESPGIPSGPEVLLDSQAAGTSQGGADRAVRRGDDQQLRKWFGGPQAEEDFTRSLLASSTSLLAHLYALNALADRWPPAVEETLSASSRTKLALMVRDHGQQAEERCSEVRFMLRPLFDAFAPAPDSPGSVANRTAPWQDSARASLNAAKDLDRLLRAVFTTTDTPEPLEQGLPLTRERLSEAARDIQTLARREP